MRIFDILVDGSTPLARADKVPFSLGVRVRVRGVVLGREKLSEIHTPVD